MEKLVQPKNTIAVLQKYQFNFQKRFGQNFLIDEHVLNKIIDAAELSKDDVALEVGPGIGTLTQALAEQSEKVFAVEIDDALIPILSENLSEYDNVKIIHEDIMKVSVDALSEKECGGRKFKVVANLPYYITTPIVMNLLENSKKVESITIMVQKEVADRMKAGPGSKDYGALSLAVQYYAEPYLVANVPMNSFMPRPDVSSAVICLKKYETPKVQVKDEKLMFQLIRASFQKRRKTLQNGLRNATELSFTKAQVENAILKIGKDLNVRGETLTLEEFARLSDAFSDAAL